MVRVDDLANLKKTLEKKLSGVVGSRGRIHNEVYSSWGGAKRIIFLVEPTTYDILPVELEIRTRLPGVSTELRTIQSHDNFQPILQGRVCLIVKFDIEYVLKANSEHTRLGIVLVLFIVCITLLYRHVRDYDFGYFRHLSGNI